MQESSEMDRLSLSRTPSPSDSATYRGNPFSIDYILSNSAASHLQPPLPQSAHITTTKPTTTTISQAPATSLQQHILNDRLALPSTPNSMPQIKLDQLQQTHPNFLYFMACMLLQRQQQQQQQQNLQRQVNQQQAAEAAAAAVAAATKQQQQLASRRQPVDLASSPADSLAILARLSAGNFGQSSEQLSHQPATQAGKLSNKQLRLPQAVQHRHQPYNVPIDHHLAPFAGQQHPMVSGHLPLHQSHHPLGNLNRLQPPLPVFDLLAGAGGLRREAGGQHQAKYPELLRGDQEQAIQAIRSHSGLASAKNDTNSSSTTGSGGSIKASGGEKLDNLKPAHSYIGLIGMCILSSPEKRMVLNDIYQFILDHYPYYRNRGSGWRNSVRHNLSLNECFQKAGRAANGKGHYWTIHPANMDDFMIGDFRRRRAQRKVRRWNNMDVPSDESDDESMDDANKPPLPEHFKRSIEMHRRLEMSYQKTASEAAKAAFMAAAAAVASANSGAAAVAVATTPTNGPHLNHHSHLQQQQHQHHHANSAQPMNAHSDGRCSPALFGAARHELS